MIVKYNLSLYGIIKYFLHKHMAIPSKYEQQNTEFVMSSKTKRRCSHCKKKSHILTKCKCGNHFCFSHRLPEVHCCTYDFKSEHTPVELVDCNFKKVDKI